MQNDGHATRRPGRPPAFDERAVVEGAIGAFWAGGYEDTSLADLERATGVDRSTLYNSFGGKAGIYARAIDAYLDAGETRLTGPLRDGERGLDDVLAFLDALRGNLALAPRGGCLIVNDMADRSSPEGAARYRMMLGSAIGAALRRAADAGEVDAGRVEDHTRCLVAAVVGVNLLGRLGLDGAELDEHIEALGEQVRSWRSAAP